MCSEKEEKERKRKRKGKRKKKEKNRLQLQPGPSGEINFYYSYRRASAGELISHYITVGPFPGIRNVILFAAMVHLGHIAEKGYVGSFHYGLVHKPVSLHEAMKIPEAKAAVDKEWEIKKPWDV